DIGPRKRFVLAAPPLGCDVVKSSAATRAPRGQYDFVDTVEAGQGLIRSPGHDAKTIARATDRADVKPKNLNKCKITKIPLMQENSIKA
ncbi:hypothetical protein Tco_0476947, partial [Tanacetum coccineum]